MASPAEATPSYIELSVAQRDEALRKMLSASLGVAGLGQDATLSYQLLGLVPAIAADPQADLGPLWAQLSQTKASAERVGRLVLALQLQLQRGYGVTPRLPDEAAGAVREALQRAGSEDALWIQVNAALVRSLTAGAGVERAPTAASTADSIAGRRRREEEKARRVNQSGAGRSARSPAAPAAKKESWQDKLPGGEYRMLVLGAAVAFLALVIFLCTRITIDVE